MQVFSTICSCLVVAGLCNAMPRHPIAETDMDDLRAAQAVAKTLSPTSHVKGERFDRFVQIWLENTDFDIAAGNPDLAWLAGHGITLTNYFAIKHPSQGNYVASAGADDYGAPENGKFRVDKSVKTIVDLLEAKDVSWSIYQEDMPYSGYQGGTVYIPREDVIAGNGENLYVRKHNPLVHYDSISLDEDRSAKCKNLTMFHEDLKNNELPQWMFITPNMRHDGHDTGIMMAGQWTREFLTPLLTDPNFMNNTLVLLTFDESEDYEAPNRVFSVLLGDAIPSELHNVSDGMSYNHFSTLATVEENWSLGNLGKNDSLATPFY